VPVYGRAQAMGIAERKEREKVQRRQSILATARDVFQEKGLQATTMEEIALRAELSKGTLYLYFDTKDDLYISMILEDFWSIEESLKDSIELEGDLMETGRSMYLAFVEHCLDNSEYIRISQYFLTEDARRNISGHLIERVQEYTSKLLGYVVRMVEEGIDSGMVRKDVNPVMFAVSAWRMTAGLLELYLSGDADEFNLGDRRELFEGAFDILINGIREKTGTPEEPL